MCRRLLALVVLGLFALQQPAFSAPSQADDLDTYFKPVQWRSIGPFRGGRSNASTGVVGDPRTYYMGTTGGGLWKTEDMGLSWRNVSDGYFKTTTIGAVAVAASDPNVVYVGTGEHAVRGVMSHDGDGVYRSTDAGKTWKRVGLELTQHIARIVIDPRNPDLVYVAAQGTTFAPSAERGVYKSSDGGTTWKKVLFVDERTGAAELSMDASNPRILYAAMWEHGRLPWKVISGGPGSGLYKSTDSGETWDRMTEGLPEEMGKMAIAVSPANPDKVYALIETDSNKDERGLYASSNAGKRWTKVSSEPQLVQRAWYYIELFADPKNENTVYVMSAPALRSDDGGKTWAKLTAPHGDFHDLWINPDDADNFIISNDGGASISFDRGQELEHAEQHAHCPVLPHQRRQPVPLPYLRRPAGQQLGLDRQPRTRQRRHQPRPVGSPSAGGESAFLAFDPDNPRYVMGGSYQGTIEVIDTQAKAGTNVMPAPIQYLGMDAKDMKYRYNWNAPIVWSRYEPNTFYPRLAVPAQDAPTCGKTWKEVSPDLTRNEKDKQGKPGGPLHQRGGRRRELRHPGLRGRIAAREGRDLDRQRRRPGAPDPRWRRNLEERDADGPGRVPDQRDRGIAVRQRHGLYRHHALQVQRPHAGAVQDHRLRRELDEDRQGHPGGRVHPRGPRRRCAPRPALRRHRAWRLSVMERRQGLDTVPAQPPDDPDHRPARAQGQPHCRDLGPVLLDTRRPQPDPAIHERPACLHAVQAGATPTSSTAAANSTSTTPRKTPNSRARIPSMASIRRPASSSTTSFRNCRRPTTSRWRFPMPMAM